MKTLVLLVVLGLSLVPSLSVRAEDGENSKTLLIDDFENGLRPGWQVKSFAGYTDYRVEPGPTGQVLRAESRGAASGLIYEVDVDPVEFPILSWRWKIDNVVPGGDERVKSGDDYAARIYVVFPHWFFPKTRTLNYIWANRLPRGDLLANAFTGNAMMFAVESGPQLAGQWIEAQRNIVEDYRRAFGSAPPRIGAIAIMTDTDNTGQQARAWYDQIELRRE